MKVRVGIASALPIAFVAMAAAPPADVELPSPGMWHSENLEVHRDSAGRAVSFMGMMARRTSSDICLSPAAAAAAYTHNPLPDCRFTLRQPGGGRTLTTHDCSRTGGARTETARRMTPTTMELQCTVHGALAGRGARRHHRAQRADRSLQTVTTASFPRAVGG